MTKILFICHGNICRSPMAEFCFRELVRQAGVHTRFEAASAAVSREELGAPMDPRAQRTLQRHDVPFAPRSAQLMTKSDYDAYDLLLGMDRENLRRMARICGGDPAGKLRLLLDFTDAPRNVADPWYSGDFEAAWADIESGCRALLRALQAAEARL